MNDTHDPETDPETDLAAKLEAIDRHQQERAEQLKSLNRPYSNFEEACSLIGDLKREINRRPQFVQIDAGNTEAPTISDASNLPYKILDQGPTVITIITEQGAWVFYACILQETPNEFADVAVMKANSGDVHLAITEIQNKRTK